MLLLSPYHCWVFICVTVTNNFTFKGTNRSYPHSRIDSRFGAGLHLTLYASSQKGSFIF